MLGGEGKVVTGVGAGAGGFEADGAGGGGGGNGRGDDADGGGGIDGAGGGEGVGEGDCAGVVPATAFRMGYLASVVPDEGRATIASIADAKLACQRTQSTD